jgi:hypothetical protein
MFRRTLTIAALVLAARPAAAQITTYIAPPRASVESRQLLASTDSVRRDSVDRATVTNMTAWVDSAAGVAVPSRVGVDSIDPGRPVTSFEDGAVAPATASMLPALLVMGVVVFGAGLFLLARPRG